MNDWTAEDFAKALMEEGADLAVNGHALCDMGLVREGRARILAGISISEVGLGCLQAKRFEEVLQSVKDLKEGNSLGLPKEVPAAAVKAALKSTEKWGFSEEESLVLVAPDAELSEHLKRVSYILGIFKSLQLLFSEPDRADAWVSKPNEAFSGLSAKEVMLSGLEGLSRVRRYLHSAQT